MKISMFSFFLNKSCFDEFDKYNQSNETGTVKKAFLLSLTKLIMSGPCLFVIWLSLGLSFFSQL